MKKLLLSLMLVPLFGNSQIFQDSFETYTNFAITGVGSWTLRDIDLLPTYGFGGGTTFLNSGLAKSFQVFSPTAVTPPLTVAPYDPAGPTGSDWTAKTGTKSMVCFAAVPTAAKPNNNDWLISPQITLGTVNTISFWAKACDGPYAAEKFKVGISSTGTLPANFTVLSGASPIVTALDLTWNQYTYNIPASFNNQPVYISINCLSDDQFGFAVDDFKVNGTLSNDSFFRNNFTVSPNPMNDVVNITKNNSLEITAATITDINGRVVKQVNNNVESINVADLNAGVYFLKVATAEGFGTTKLIKN